MIWLSLSTVFYALCIVDRFQRFGCLVWYHICFLVGVISELFPASNWSLIFLSYQRPSIFEFILLVDTSSKGHPLSWIQFFYMVNLLITTTFCLGILWWSVSSFCLCFPFLFFLLYYFISLCKEASWPSKFFSGCFFFWGKI